MPSALTLALWYVVLRERDIREGAFIDAAAVLTQIDLVITSDTAMAHLAGAMGLEVWVALSRSPDWRWMAAGDRSPWYPTMRLFRQAAAGDWDDVFERIADALRTRVRCAPAGQ